VPLYYKKQGLSFSNACIIGLQLAESTTPAIIVIPTMTSLSSLEELPDSSQYTDWKELRRALDRWAVRYKFTYRGIRWGRTITVVRAQLTNWVV
jgi:hypothetical protein